MSNIGDMPWSSSGSARSLCGAWYFSSQAIRHMSHPEDKQRLNITDQRGNKPINCKSAFLNAQPFKDRVILLLSNHIEHRSKTNVSWSSPAGSYTQQLSLHREHRKHEDRSEREEEERERV